MSSVVVGDQAPLDRGAGGPVVPDRGGHGQQALGDAGVDAAGGSGAVAFQVELAFEGVVDRLDPLADPADGPMAGCLVAAVGTDHAQPEPAGDQVLELAPGEPLVADQGQSGPQGMSAGGVGEQLGGYLAFAHRGAG